MFSTGEKMEACPTFTPPPAITMVVSRRGRVILNTSLSVKGTGSPVVKLSPTLTTRVSKVCEGSASYTTVGRGEELSIVVIDTATAEEVSTARPLHHCLHDP
jgi:hypothetical protein